MVERRRRKKFGLVRRNKKESKIVVCVREEQIERKERWERTTNKGQWTERNAGRWLSVQEGKGHSAYPSIFLHLSLIFSLVLSLNIFFSSFLVSPAQSSSWLKRHQGNGFPTRQHTHWYMKNRSTNDFQLSWINRINFSRYFHKKICNAKENQEITIEKILATKTTFSASTHWSRRGLMIID